MVYGVFFFLYIYTFGASWVWVSLLPGNHTKQIIVFVGLACNVFGWIVTSRSTVVRTFAILIRRLLMNLILTCSWPLPIGVFLNPIVSWKVSLNSQTEHNITL